MSESKTKNLSDDNRSHSGDEINEMMNKFMEVSNEIDWKMPFSFYESGKHGDTRYAGGNIAGSPGYVVDEDKDNPE